MSSQNKKRMAVFFGVAIFFIVLDRFFKSLAMQLNGGETAIFFDWLNFMFVKNYNIALSLPLSGALVTFLILCLTLIVVYYCLLFIKKEDVINASSMFLIALGAISNLVDRIIYGFVIDYLDVKYFSVLNLADIMITTGVLLFIIFSFYQNKKQAF